MASIYHQYLIRSLTSNGSIDTKWAFDGGGGYSSDSAFSIEVDLKNVNFTGMGEHPIISIGSGSSYVEAGLKPNAATTKTSIYVKDSSITSHNDIPGNPGDVIPDLRLVLRYQSGFQFSCNLMSGTASLSNTSLSVSSSTLRLFANHAGGNSGTGLAANLCKCTVYARKGTTISADRNMVYCGVPFSMQWGNTLLPATLYDCIGQLNADLSGTWNVP